MIIRPITFVALATLSLTACQPMATEQDVPQEETFEQRIERAAEQIQTAQNELFHAGVLNKKRNEPPVFLFDDNEQRISVEWDGDAKGLLTKLAKDSGRTFKSIGVAMPLPVSIDQDETTFHHVIEHVQSQIGFRAVVSYTLTEITLHYHKPQD